MTKKLTEEEARKRLKKLWNEEANMYRVWVHPYDGDDFYFLFYSLKEAVKKYKSLKKSGSYTLVEKPIKVGELK